MSIESLSFNEMEIAERKLQAIARPIMAGHHVVVVVPAYNEERFIGSVALKICKHPVDLIVVDDGSVDQTAEIARMAGAIVVRQGSNQGKGAALNVGFVKARELNPDVIVILDADGQHLPEELPAVIQPVIDGQADVVVGSRYLVKKSRVPTHRILGHRFFNWITGIASGVLVSDSQSGFRAFSPRAFQNATFSSKSFSVESEMQFWAAENRLRLVEVPITIAYSDPPKRPVFQHGLMVLNGILKMTGQYRPFLFFGLPGLFLIIAGILWGLRVVDIYTRAHQLAVGYTLISVLFSMVGVVMFSTGVTLHSIRGLLLEILHRQVR